MKTSFPLLWLASLTLVLFLSGCTAYKARRYKTFQKIDEMKEEVLLVRLKTSESKIEALKKAGESQLAREEGREVAKRHQAIMESFRTHFDFCPVYFFYSSEGKKLRDGQFSGVQLLDTGGNTVNGAMLADADYLVAEFGYAYSDQLVSTDEEGNRSAAAGTQGLPALVVMDADYIQLPKPFPYSVSLTGGREDYAWAVGRLNEKLRDFYIVSNSKRHRWANY